MVYVLLYVTTPLKFYTCIQTCHQEKLAVSLQFYSLNVVLKVWRDSRDDCSKYMYLLTLHRYMKRRCLFLDNLPAFNYNAGCGEYVKAKGRKKRTTTDTKRLGSTLMETMLKEVSDFCDPAIKESWSQRPHQQVSVYLFLFLGVDFSSCSAGQSILEKK